MNLRFHQHFNTKEESPAAATAGKNERYQDVKVDI
jgi:hypothetical protein